MFIYREFVANINGVHHFANTAGGLILFHTWDLKPANDTITAMNQIAACARQYGYKTMRTFVDRFDSDRDVLLAYVQLKNGVSTWTDGRFTAYEWNV